MKTVMPVIHKIRLACLSGTALEFFEFQVFIMLMPYLVVQFFAPSAGYAAAYLVFGVAFLARPLGSLLLGFIGDHHGRRFALLLAMWLMAGATVLMGLLPGWAVLGSVATSLLVSCRIAQGLSLGGEYACGFVFLYEHLRIPRCRDLIWTDMGGCIGSASAALLATLTAAVFSASEMQSFAWRIPLLASVLLAACGIYIRASLPDPASHPELIRHNRSRRRLPYYRDVFTAWPTLLLASLACAPNGIIWYLMLVFVPHEVVPLGVDKLMYFSVITLACLWPGALLADQFGRYRVWILSVVAMTVNFIFLVSAVDVKLQTGAFFLQAVLLAINMGPRIFILSRIFPLAMRATGCSFAYSVANVFGGLTPYAAWWLQAHYLGFGVLKAALVGVNGVAMVSMLLLSRRCDHDDLVLAVEAG